jgi:two-component system NtrC family sensor kinase
MKLRLKTRLILELQLPIIFAVVISVLVGTDMICRNFLLQARNNIQLDINSARLIYRNALDEMRGPLLLAAAEPTIRDTLLGGPSEPAAARMEQLRATIPLDLLDLLDPQGKVIVRSRTPSRYGDSLAADPMIRAVMGGQAIVASTGIASPQELRQEAEALADTARIPIVAPHEATATQTEEARGMLLKTAVAVKDKAGRLVGILYGARLLNRDERIVGEIYQTIFKGEIYKGRQVGEATLCLYDVRIATLLTQDGRREVGTSIAPDVRDQVLGRGLPWIGRASVVGEWHLTAYEPIRDFSGRIVGVLALGILEEKLTDIRQKTLMVFFVITFCGAFLSIMLASLTARSVTLSIRKLLRTVQEVADGNLDCQADTRSSVCEIAQLGMHINRMALSLKERDLVIKRQTEEKISRSERLAIVGRLAAGVAHQINNPLGGIMLFSNLLLNKAPKEGLERENLERIFHEAQRCQKIVQGLLDFARHREPKLERADIGIVIDRTLQLVENQSMFLDISIERRYGDVPPVDVDVSQMQEVFLNIILNAVEAMDGRGTLTVTTETVDNGDNVRISIADTGCGIAEELVERVFEPFFTTKEEGKGTGLGLSVSRGFVEANGGNIWASSVPGKGTIFFIRLPASDERDFRGKDS